MKTRKIIKARRPGGAGLGPSAGAEGAAAANPFAGFSFQTPAAVVDSGGLLVPPAGSAAQPASAAVCIFRQGCPSMSKTGT